MHLVSKETESFYLDCDVGHAYRQGRRLSVSVLNVVGQARSQVLCRWSGFADPESPITSFTFFVGTAAGLHDVIEPVTLAGYTTRYPAGMLLNRPLTERIC